MDTYVYVDGFNLYYGALKSRWPMLKWLDLERFCTALLPAHNILMIRYFTAGVIPMVHDPQTRARQDTYIRVLGTLPHLRIHKSWFLQGKGLRHQFPLAYVPNRSPSVPPQSVYVSLPQEKGSDVNLATYLLFDGFNGKYDQAVVISNDSDLAEPITIATTELHKTVGVINPHPKSRRSSVLAKVATWTFQDINKSFFLKSQFPTTLTDASGTTTKPSTW